MKRIYFLDGKEIDWLELIDKAEEYEDMGSFKQTSMAARILRDDGHTVEQKYIEEKEV